MDTLLFLLAIPLGAALARRFDRPSKLLDGTSVAVAAVLVGTAIVQHPGEAVEAAAMMLAVGAYCVAIVVLCAGVEAIPAWMRRARARYAGGAVTARRGRGGWRTASAPPGS